jgi:hypothetical protein
MTNFERPLLRAVAVAALSCLLVACHRAQGDAAKIVPAVAASAAAFFQHHFIDRQSPGAADCCTDVLALADVSGDGYPDVIIGAQEARGAGLVWYEFPTWRRHDIARGEFTTDGKALDFDGDGDIDVVVGDLSAGLVWYEQGSEGRWVRHPIGAGYTHDVVVADLNGDGRQDVVRTDKKSLEVWYADKDGFRHETILQRTGEGLAVADLDGDGDRDMVFSNLWLENVAESGRTTWAARELAPHWSIDTRIAVADVDGDGRLDVVLTGSEGEAGLAWFAAPAAIREGPWVAHRIESAGLVGTHSLAVADFDLDGDLDVVVAEMHTSPGKRVLLYLQTATGWQAVPLATHGSHNVMAADLDRDGDADVVGKNYGGVGRFIELWENRAADLRSVPARQVVRPSHDAALTGWTYEALDPVRPEYDRHTFGLITGDVNSDGATDLAAGGTLYLQNLDRTKSGRWHFTRIAVAPGSDIIHMTPYRHFGMRDLLAVSEEWLELRSAADSTGRRWLTKRLRRLPPGRVQGYAAGPPASDGSYDFFFTKGQKLFKLMVPVDAAGPWRLILVTTGVEEAGVAVADLDADGDMDAVAVDGGGRRLVWLEAAPSGLERHALGAGLHWFDRVAIADVNGDRRPDILFTEETRDWDYNARVGWLEAPSDPRRLRDWRAHTVATLRSANSLDGTDFDGDGDVDLVVAEHTDMYPGKVAPDNFTGVYLNDGAAHWTLEPVEVGAHSSHLGARSVDLDGDGAPELISIGWQQHTVHLWSRPAAAVN